MLFSKSDIYFAADDAHKFLPWLVGIMVFLATLLLCLGVTVGSWVIDKGGSYANSFTINVPAGTENSLDKIAKIEEVLKQIDNITGVNRISDSELQDMLKPWLGDGKSMADLPMPVVLEVTIDSGAGTKPIDYNGLQRTLQAVAPGVEIDAHELWVAAFSSFAGAMKALTIILSVLIITGIAMMISFTSRAALRLHSKTVHLLHSIGAEDSYVSRQFQMESFRLVLPGALIGSIAAGLSYMAAGAYISSLQTSIMPSLAISRGHIALIAAMPVACTMVAWFVTRLSVIRQLGRSL